MGKRTPGAIIGPLVAAPLVAVGAPILAYLRACGEATGRRPKNFRQAAG